MRREFAWISVFLPLSVAFTWPLAPRLGTHLAGDAGDGWQNLWNIVWVWRSLFAGRSPFFTDALHHPHGASLVFQTFDLPDAVLFAPLLAVLPPVTVYGVVVLWTFVATGASGYVSARLLGASRPAAFAAGAALTFSTYHFGHALGHLHILAVQWVPMFVAGLHRAIEGRSWRWAVFAGVAGGLAGLSSWYHLLACLVLGAVLAPFALWRTRAAGLPSAVIQSAVAIVSVLVVAGPLAWAVVDERAREPMEGAHSAVTFSADVESFVVPNGAQALGTVVQRWRRWTGNPAENATYLGFVLLAAGVWGLVRRVPRSGALLSAAFVGVVLSLGPRLHVGGAIVTGDVLPYALLERWVPLLGFTGVPVRLASVATVALALLLAPVLDELARRRGRVWAVVVALLAVAEHAPHGFVGSRFPAPAPVVAWAFDPERWAVLDATRDSRHLWHQVLHGHPIVGGYVTRTARRLERCVEQHPVAGPLLAWDAPERSIPVTLERVDFDTLPPVPGTDPRRFSFDVTAPLDVDEPGAWHVSVESDDGARVWVDGILVVDNGGIHPRQQREGSVSLDPGRHRVRVSYDQQGGGAMLSLRLVAPSGQTVAISGPWEGRARVRRRALGASPEAALERLRAERIRKVIVDAREDRYLLETELGLVPEFDGDGIRIYDVPGVR